MAMDWSRSPGSDPAAVRAGFGPRFGALLIDSLVFTGAILLISFATGHELYESSPPPESSDAFGPWVLWQAILFVSWVVYFVILEGGASGQTLGKRAAGIRVADQQTGGPIGFWRGLGRMFARIVSGIPCYLGYFWMLWDPEKQTWHDRMTRTVVVPVTRQPAQNAGAT